MTTLYEILGLSQNATVEQIDQAYILQTEKLKNESKSPEVEALKLKAIKEAYYVLSSPVRRQSYNDKLFSAKQLTYETIETTSSPWLKIALLSAALLGGGIYYYKQESKARAEQIAMEAAKAKAEADKAAALAAAEQANLERTQLLERQRALTDEQRQMEQARREGQQIQYTLAQQEEQAARERAQAERQEKYEHDREEQAARIRVQNQNAAMQRALNIPINRH